MSLGISKREPSRAMRHAVWHGLEFLIHWWIGQKATFWCWRRGTREQCGGRRRFSMSSPKVIDKQLNGVLEFGDGQIRLRTMCGSLYQLVFEVNAEFGELGFHASDIVRNFVLERMKLFCKASNGLGRHARDQTQMKAREGSDYQLM